MRPFFYSLHMRCMWVMEEYYFAGCWMTDRAPNFTSWLHRGCASNSMKVAIDMCPSHLKRDPVPVHCIDREWIHIFKCFFQFGPFVSMLIACLPGRQTGCKALCFGIFHQLWLRSPSMMWRLRCNQTLSFPPYHNLHWHDNQTLLNHHQF